MDLWQFILDKISVAINVQLLYVLESEGSSPGRQGFKMAVAADGDFSGTIGGGIMEYKLVEKAKQLLVDNESKVVLMRQYHDKEHAAGQSGMICSGSQLNVFIPLSVSDQKNIEAIVKGMKQNEQKIIQLSSNGVIIQSDLTGIQKMGLQFASEEDWQYIEKLNQQPVIHIVGGGHVSLALSEIMDFLGFYIKVYDDRPGLNTLQQNRFTDEKIIIPGYEKLGEYVASTANDYVVIMTVGYRTDKTALRQLLKKNFTYLGLLGSEKKIKNLLSELKEEGVSPVSLTKIFTPIGINIFSKTTQEIAVSIAAEIIREKNKNLPTGRQPASQ